MMLFWTIAALLIAAALLFVLPPLLGRRDGQQGPTQKALNIAVYRDQLAELEADLRNGNLDQAQFEQARSDLQRSLLETAGDAPASVAASAGKAQGRWVVFVVGVALPLFASGLYMVLGGGAAALDPKQLAAGLNGESHMGSVEDMIVSLQKRLESKPDNPAGWAMLARSLYVVGRHAEAGDAYARAIESGAGDEPDVLAGYADVLALQQGRVLAGKPMELLARALQIDPDHQKSLWLAGTGAYQAKDFRTARDYWRRLAALLPPGSEDAQTMQANLAELDKLMAGEAPR